MNSQAGFLGKVQHPNTRRDKIFHFFLQLFLDVSQSLNLIEILKFYIPPPFSLKSYDWFLPSKNRLIVSQIQD